MLGESFCKPVYVASFPQANVWHRLFDRFVFFYFYKGEYILKLTSYCICNRYVYDACSNQEKYWKSVEIIFIKKLKDLLSEVY